MKKVIIPRKDHEVYFLPAPEKNKSKKQVKQYVNEQMDKLHPVFTTQAIDTKQVKINDTRHLMVTVMDEKTLKEYRILHNRAAFYTNTSVFLFKKDLLEDGIKAIDDESIGYNPKTSEFLSVPLDRKTDGKQQFENELGNIPLRQSVFRKSPNMLFMPLICAGLLLLVFIFYLRGLLNNDIIQTVGPAPVQIMEHKETPKERIPDPTEILVSISKDITGARGKILQWQYNLDSDPLLSIRLAGMNLSDIYNIFGAYDYAQLQDIQEIRYEENIPHITIFLDIDKNKYETAAVKTFQTRDSVFSMFTGLSRSFRNNGISIITESLPAAVNGYFAYSINYTAIDWNLIVSLDILSAFCFENALIIKNLDIKITEASLFAVNCTLSVCDTQILQEHGLGSEKYLIPAAFGYVRQATPTAAIQTAAMEQKAPVPVIGSIRDSSGNTVFYRNTTDGKIQVRVENE